MSEKVKMLLVEGIHPGADHLLNGAGVEVSRLTGSPNSRDLIRRLKGVSLLGGRSRTNITQDILEATSLLAVGAFCIGVNQIDLRAATHKGIAVFNAPYSNTRSVAELVAGLVISLARRVCAASRALHAGKWQKSAKGSFEVRGKTLGIVGYGHIGSQVSVLAESLGMRVLYHDIVSKLPIGNARPCADLFDLLKRCDFVTVHVPETPQTQGLISKEELKALKKGGFLINTSRGSVVNMDHLKSALISGHLAGAALDVFPEEPSLPSADFSSPLQNLPGVILTPHIGGSTEEAQRAIGREVSESLIDYLHLGATEASVNFPKLSPPPVPLNARRIANVHKNQPGVLGQINSIVSRAGANIKAQYLSTNEAVGYLIMDVEKGNGEALCREVGRLPFSLKTRQIFPSPPAV